MSRVVCKTVYKFDELSDDAKDKARDWYRQDLYWDWEYVYEDAAEIAELFGLDIRTKPVKLTNGKVCYDPCIWFSGFSSQGDGACFEGTYRYKKGALRAVKAHAPKDEELHGIVARLQRIQMQNFYKLRATCKHSGHYYHHSGCMSVEVEHCDDQYRDIGDSESEIRDNLRWFADWIYDRLESEFDYQNSDEAVDESIRINEYDFDEYDFDEDGSRT